MKVTRLNGGRFVLPTTQREWENKCTSNSSGVFLPYSAEMMELLSNALEIDITEDVNLREGVVVSVYTGCGTVDGDPHGRQRRGLAIFTPDLTLRYRKQTPILSPDVQTGSKDKFGVEDARITYTDGRFILWYCGYDGEKGVPCCAVSKDLIHWKKHMPIAGGVGEHEDKDHIIFPEPFHGKWWMLHRPWHWEVGDNSNYVIRLASAPTVLGPWTDEGELLRGLPSPEKKHSWVGGGAPPLKIGEGRYLELYHNGCFFHDGFRRYEGCAMIVDLNEYRKGDLSKIVSCRMEPFLEPETQEEHNEAWKIDIVFPMSAHVYKEDLYFLYGAGDAATCAAKVNFTELMRTLKEIGEKEKVRNYKFCTE